MHGHLTPREEGHIARWTGIKVIGYSCKKGAAEEVKSMYELLEGGYEKEGELIYDRDEWKKLPYCTKPT